MYHYIRISIMDEPYITTTGAQERFKKLQSIPLPHTEIFLTKHTSAWLYHVTISKWVLVFYKTPRVHIPFISTKLKYYALVK